jgi:hypothetical protein
MPRRLFFKLAGVLFLTGFCCGFSTQARAGFQWVAPAEPLPPANQITVNPAPRNPAAPPASLPLSVSPLSPSTLDSTNPEVITPIIIEGTKPKLPVTSSPHGKVEETPVYEGPIPPVRPVQPPSGGALPPSAAGASVSTQEEIVHGFAKSVPLAVALRQILPAGYSFSIDQGVDMGTMVSFQGGRPWRETLRDALKPAGLVMREKGRMIGIGYENGEVVSPPLAKTSVYIPADALPPTTRMYADTRPVVVEPPASPPARSGPGTWTAQHGDSLHKVLEEWCRRSNVEFDWLAEYDYPVEASVSFNGTFEDAVRGLLAGFESAHPQPVAELHSNPRVGQMVLVVQTRGNTNTD